jgi:hypothetical protein
MNFLSFAREQPTPRELVDLNQLAERLVELRHFDLMVAKTELLVQAYGTIERLRRHWRRWPTRRRRMRAQFRMR